MQLFRKNQGNLFILVNAFAVLVAFLYYAEPELYHINHSARLWVV